MVFLLSFMRFLSKRFVITIVGEENPCVTRSFFTLQISSAEIDLPNYGFWLIENGQNAAVSLNIAPSEIDGELSLGDLTEEQQLQYAQQVGEMFDNPEIHLDTTPSGNKYLHVCSNEEDDIDTLFTLYKGCFVELIQYNDNFAQLSVEDAVFCLSLLHGIEFVAAE